MSARARGHGICAHLGDREKVGRVGGILGLLVLELLVELAVKLKETIEHGESLMAERCRWPCANA